MTDTELILTFLTAVPAAFLLTVLLCRCIIPLLRRYHVGQHIFADVVKEHRNKEGTPTMGGVCFILPFLLLLVPYFLLCKGKTGMDLRPLALTVALGVANAMIGFIDDFTKLSHKQNQGLHSWQKFLLQLVAAGGYLWGMGAIGAISTVVDIPILERSFDLGVFYYFIALIVIVGVVNSTNLTDGIDGLASSVTLVAAMGLSLLSFMLLRGDGAVVGALLIGGMIGFLVFNFHPAKVFMGDTGSLFLGGVLIGAGFMLDLPIVMVLLCGVFILDMLSSMIQIISLRVFHRRVFPIAPVHHAFQQMHWSEQKIVYVFSGVGLLFGALAILCVILL